MKYVALYGKISGIIRPAACKMNEKKIQSHYMLISHE